MRVAAEALRGKVAHMLPLEKLLLKAIGSDGVAMMRGMLQYQPHQRMTAAQCLQHPFFSQYRQPGAAAPAASQVCDSRGLEICMAE